MPTKAATTNRLPKLAGELTNLFNQMETCYVTVCRRLGDARDEFDDDDEFWDWTEDHTPFKRQSANEYLAVSRNVIDRHGNDDKLKSLPFSALRAISRENVPKSVQNKVIQQFVKAAKNPDKVARPKLADVKQAVNAALGKETPRRFHVVPAVVRDPAPADRLAQCHKHDTSAVWLFGLRETYNPADAAMVVKHWKQKHHPDKGGNAADFALINTKAATLELK